MGDATSRCGDAISLGGKAISRSGDTISRRGTRAVLAARSPVCGERGAGVGVGLRVSQRLGEPAAAGGHLGRGRGRGRVEC